MEEIVSVDIVPVSFWSGIGIHLTLRGWVWNVAFGRGVQIHRCGGMPIVLGTDDPEALVAQRSGAGAPASDTIVAIATPPGKGAIAIVRISGPRTRELAARLVQTTANCSPRYATYATIVGETGRAIDRGLALFFPAPTATPAKTRSNCRRTARRSSRAKSCARCWLAAREWRSPASSPAARFSTERWIFTRPRR